MPVMGTCFSYQLGCLSRTEGVVAFGLLKTNFGFEPVPRCQPSPLADDTTTWSSGPVINHFAMCFLIQVQGRCGDKAN